MSILIGVSLALLVGGVATWSGLDRDRAFYPTVTIVIAAIYVLFAAMAGSEASLLAECAVMGAFLIAAITGFRKSLWLVVAALAGHGVLDLVHPHLIDNPGVPAWWPSFCSAYDLVAAFYLAALLLRRVGSGAWERRHTDGSSPGKVRASGSSARLPASAIQGPTFTRTTSSS